MTEQTENDMVWPLPMALICADLMERQVTRNGRPAVSPRDAKARSS